MVQVRNGGLPNKKLIRSEINIPGYEVFFPSFLF